MNPIVIISLFGVLTSTMGVSLVFKDYMASLLAGVIMRRVRNIQPGVRVKILGNPVIKGDIIAVGPVRTTMMEVGDGEHLPSVRTGRTIKVPNFALVNNPILLYGDNIIDEVVAYEKAPFVSVDTIVDDMKEAIGSQGHHTVEVGLYQKEDKLIIHGIFQANTSEVVDIRSRILRAFIERRTARQAPVAAVNPVSLKAV